MADKFAVLAITAGAFCMGYLAHSDFFVLPFFIGIALIGLAYYIVSSGEKITNFWIRDYKKLQGRYLDLLDEVSPSNLIGYDDDEYNQDETLH